MNLCVIITIFLSSITADTFATKATFCKLKPGSREPFSRQCKCVGDEVVICCIGNGEYPGMNIANLTASKTSDDFKIIRTKSCGLENWKRSSDIVLFGSDDEFPTNDYRDKLLQEYLKQYPKEPIAQVPRKRLEPSFVAAKHTN